jgi:hypothetical protein
VKKQKKKDAITEGTLENCFNLTKRNFKELKKYHTCKMNLNKEGILWPNHPTGVVKSSPLLCQRHRGGGLIIELRICKEQLSNRYILSKSASFYGHLFIPSVQTQI